MLTAIVREVSSRLAECEVSFQERSPIDVPLARRQHAEYCRVLAELGAKVVTLPALDEYPDCVFVEDPIVVLDEIAIVARMGAESRRGEAESLAKAVGRYRELLFIEAPGTLEGGDVMRIGKTLTLGFRNGRM
jgi:dimethylargininase